ncbi:MAG TPA: hypothetical protein VGL55_02305 [Steroidobacteraceae bacterium]|jgi:hypothetical protein
MFTVGSAQHREAFARFFLDSHVEYEPAAAPWPPLTAASLARLVSLPFWQDALSTENVTSSAVTAAAALEPDPLLRRAIALQGFEERRHAHLLLELTAHYGIPVHPPERFEPRSLERDFLRAGFGECFDSFFAFGLFALARDSGYFVPELVLVFEPVIQEEARHILFFVNWIECRRARLPWWWRPAFRLRCTLTILSQVAARARMARRMGGRSEPGNDNFTLTGHRDLRVNVRFTGLLQLCQSENERRLGRYDRRLLRPRLVPRAVKTVLHVLTSWPLAALAQAK